MIATYIVAGAFLILCAVMFGLLSWDQSRQAEETAIKCQKMMAWYETLDKDKKAHIMDVVWQCEDFRMKQRIYNTFKDL